MPTGTYTDRPFQRPSVVETTTTTMGTGPFVHCRISWATIIGAVILVVTVQLLLSLLGAGIRLGTVNMNAGSTPDASSLGVGAGLWWVVSSIVALAFGGYAAPWLARAKLRLDSILHGLTTWGIATLLTVYLLSSAIGSIIGGGASALLGRASRVVY